MVVECFLYNAVGEVRDGICPSWIDSGYDSLTDAIHTCFILALFHCMVRHGTVWYGSLLGGFPLGTVPGT